MNIEEYKYTCPRCGNEFKSSARCCMKCGYINPVHPENAEYLKKYGQDLVEEYTVSGNTITTTSQNIPTKSGNINLSVSSSIGNYTICFVLNYLFYLIVVIGIIYSYYSASQDIYGMIKSDLGAILLSFTMFSLVQYATQLIYMKMNRHWIFAIIPFVNLYVLSDVFSENKIMNFLVFIPIVGEFYLLYLIYKLGDSFNKNGFLTLLFPYLMFLVIGFGSSSFNNIYYIGKNDSLEKQYHKKKIYWSTCLIVLIASIAMIIYNFI